MTWAITPQQPLRPHLSTFYLDESILLLGIFLISREVVFERHSLWVEPEVGSECYLILTNARTGEQSPEHAVECVPWEKTQ